MRIKTEHEKLKKLVTKEEIERTQSFDTPQMATERILCMTPPKACALIDCLDPLTAAFVIVVIRELAHDYSSGVLPNITSNAILDRAEKLDIKGLKGLCHARDEVYKKTGVFLV